MMKKFFLVSIAILLNLFFSYGQEFAYLNIVTLNNNDLLTDRTTLILESKVKQLLNHYGVQSELINPKVYMVPVVNLLDSKVIQHTSPMVMTKLEISIFVTDPYSKVTFGSYTIATIGVGRNDQSSYYDALQNIATGENDEFSSFLTKSTQRIADYFDKNCELYLAESKMLAANWNYLDAIGILLSIPANNRNCFENATRLVESYYLDYQKMNCQKRLIMAESYHSIGDLNNVIKQLAMVPYDSKCFEEASIIIQKLSVEQRRQYDMEYQLQRDFIKSAKEVAIAEAVRFAPEVDVSYLIVN